MTSKINPRVLFITIAILIAAATRLLPHPPNFTPIAAMALFGGAYFSRKWLAFVVPFAAMFIADLFIGFHGLMWAVYLSFALIVGIGFLLSSNKKILPVLTAAVGSSLLFFIITNFAVWIGSPFYPQNVAGLIECYVAAIPFFKNSLLGDVFFTSVLFGGFYLAQIQFPSLVKVKS